MRPPCPHVFSPLERLLRAGASGRPAFPSVSQTRQIEMPNVFGIGRKLACINTMLQEIEVIKGR
jgi:hypothetical protein